MFVSFFQGIMPLNSLKGLYPEQKRMVLGRGGYAFIPKLAAHSITIVPENILALVAPRDYMIKAVWKFDSRFSHIYIYNILWLIND